MANGKSYFLLEIEGMEGESPDANYPGFMEIDNWQWDVSMFGTAQTGSGMAMGKATLGTFTFNKNTDKASIKLFEACSTGAHIGTALCVGRKQGRTSGELEEFVKYTFNNLVVTGFDIGGGDGGGLPTENVAISFEEVQIEYDQKNADGTSAGFKSARFNSKTNVVG